tara:strand:+ start:1063 stop:2670 length:1608 start_codon:yes stop_codon:yes gene_type:complete
MKQITLRPYQTEVYNDILNSLKSHKSVLGVVPTGGGKSVIIGKLCQVLPGRTLVLTHRTEIMTQNAEWVDNVGCLSGKINTLRYDNKVVIAMVQTVAARLKKYGLEYLGDFDNIILDEVQILIFEKVFAQYNHSKMIGFTATPIVDKIITTSIDDVEYVEPYTLSLLFEDIVQGIDTQPLIDMGMLVQDRNIVLEVPDFENLKESDSSPDGYTKKSLEEVYSNRASLDLLIEAYEKYGKGKKTLIFNASAKINKIVTDRFKELGLNAKLFDSVNPTEINPNTQKKYTRNEIIEWFANEDDAILINVNVFTTGFSNNEVECVIMNRATKSLSLWIQIIGRGSRPSKKIFKDFFNVVDLGQNIAKHGRWSENRDWEQYFHAPGKKLKKINDMLLTWECDSCYYLNEVGIAECGNCGEPKSNVKINGKVKKEKEGELVELEKMPLPKGNSIVRYATNLNEDANFAFKVLDKAVIELFKHYKVDREFYTNRRDEFVERVKNIYRPSYFVIIKSDLKGKRRRLNTQMESIISKIDKIYGE